MKIGINALGLTSGSAGGMEIYFLNLIKNISRYDRKHNYLIYLNHKEIKEMLASYRNSTVRLKYTSELYTYLVGGLVLLLIRPKLVLEAAKKLLSGKAFRINTSGILGKITNLNRSQQDVIHFPFSTIDPSFFNIKAPVVLTIPDIQHEYYPEFFDKTTLSDRKTLYEYSIKRADIIITISESSKSSLVEKFGIRPEKIVVTYLSCSDAFRKITDPGTLNLFRKKYSLPDDFLLYPAGTWPHKNHIKLLQAFTILRDKYGFDKHLVLTGIPQNNHEKVANAIDKYELKAKVRVLNFVPFEDMPGIYNLASLLVFPSLFEGFGIPLIEAMNTGLPITCSDRTSIPEIAGQAALYFDPESPEDMAEKIYHLWCDKPLRQKLVERGFERSKLFSWKQTVLRTVEAYELAAIGKLST